MAYGFETSIDQIINNVTVGIGPQLKQLIKKRLQEDVDPILDHVAQTLADEIEIRTQYVTDFELAKPKIVLMIDKKEVPRKTRD